MYTCTYIYPLLKSFNPATPEAWPFFMRLVLRYLNLCAVLRIRDVYPGSRILIFYPSRISDLGSRNLNKREGEKICCHTFFLATNSQNWKLFYFWNAEEKNLAQFSKNYRIFYPKICQLSSKKYGFGIPDPGPGVEKAPDPGSGSATLPVRYLSSFYSGTICTVLDLCFI
jgi:hypothetical protein